MGTTSVLRTLCCQDAQPSETMMDEIAEIEPLAPFRRWLDEAWKGEPNAHAMTLATATPEGRPSARAVLLKGLDARGFVFYTNLESRKSDELFANPHAALCFLWKSLNRQVRVEGTVEQVADDEADAYFASRPRDSQLGAWASDQSRPLASHALLERRVDEFSRRFEEGTVPRPIYWSGFRVVPQRVEFWQERPYRLHDRLLFIREGEGWRRERLFP
jgi:pyridoxamine 5'-phosphate oxidase